MKLLTVVTMAMALCGAAGAALADEALSPQELERAGWTLVTGSDDTFVFMRLEGRNPDGVRRVWTAYDSAQKRDREGFSFMSVSSLSEYDCKRRLSRVVDETFHDGRALKGRTWKMPNFKPTPWAAPAADSIGAVRMAFACRALSDT